MAGGRGRVVRLLAAPLLALLIAGPAAALTRDPAQMPAGTYVFDKKHTVLLARVRHMGLSGYTMRFTVTDAHFDHDPKNPGASKVSVTVDANSLDTGQPQYGPQFARQFLDAEHNPTITFVSTGLKQTGPESGVLSGDLTLRGITHPVELNVVFDGYTASAIAGQRAGFSASGRIDRTQFGSTFLSPDIVADDVDLTIEVEFLKQ
jgi:polyisoprenoid-binding protein YceI